VVLPPDALFGVFIYLDFEEEDITGASSYQRTIVHQIHLTQIHFGHPVKSVLAGVLGLDDESLTLPVETVDLISLVVVEAFVWKVLFGAAQDLLLGLPDNGSLGQVIDEVDMLQLCVMKQIDVNHVVRDESTGNEWVREGLVAHRVVVQAEQLVDIELILLDLFGCSVDFSEGSQVEVSIIVVYYCIFLAVGVLLDLLQFDVLVLSSSNFL